MELLTAALFSVNHLSRVAWDERMGAGVVDVYLMVGRFFGDEEVQ